MKKLTILIALACFGMSVIAQEKKALKEQIKEGKYKTSIGWTIKEGDTIPIGKGTLQNFNYAHIYKSPGNAIKIIGIIGSGNGGTPETSIDKTTKVPLVSNQAKRLIVKGFFLDGTKRGGYTIMAKVGVGSAASNYYLDIENAISSNEIVVPEQYRKKSVATSSASTTSTADELKKYKELLDNGTITKEEFEAKKKQLLNL